MKTTINEALEPNVRGAMKPAADISAKRRAAGRFRRNVPLLLMFLPVAAFFIIFKYVPMLGNIIAFKQYNLVQGVLGSPWAGMDNFRMIFSNPQTLLIIRNTLMISLLSIVIGFPFPILIAVMLNEVRRTWLKKTVQTLLYMPHFFSWVIIGGIVVTLFGTEAGVINNLIVKLGGEPISFLYKSGSWLAVFFGSGIWKEAGFSAIIYLAAVGGIDPHLYESAALDGAGKLKQIWHVTLPGILPIIVLMSILSMGRVMEVGFDQVYNLHNAVVSDVSSVISTYIFTIGIQSGLYSITTAMGLFDSVIGFTLVFTANRLARKFNQSLW